MSRTLLLAFVGLSLTAALVGQTRTQQAPRETAAVQIDTRPLSTGPGAASAQQPSQAPAIQLETTNPSITETPFNINLTEPVSLKLLLSGLAQNSGLNLQMVDAIDRKVFPNLRDTTLNEALELILEPEKLHYKIEDRVLKVFKPEMVMETLEFVYSTAVRTRSTSLSASATAGFSGGGVGGLSSAGGGVSGGSSTSLSGTESVNLPAQVEADLQNFRTKEPGGVLTYNKQLGQITVRDFPENIEAMKHYLEKMKTAAVMQVTIEAKLVEVQLNKVSQRGVNWSVVLGNTINLTSSFAQQSAFTPIVSFKGFDMLISNLSQYGDVNVLSSPSVSTLNGQPAVVKIGTQDVFFVTQVTRDPRTDSILQTAETPATINEGVVLDVTPNIGSDGTIIMNIHPTITERTGEKVSAQGNSVPLLDLRETDTVLRVRNNDTIVIAGLIQSKDLRGLQTSPMSKVPIIGNFFGSKKSKETKKTDLVIMLTPHIYSLNDIPKITQDREDHLEVLRKEQEQEYNQPKAKGKGKK